MKKFNIQKFFFGEYEEDSTSPKKMIKEIAIPNRSFSSKVLVGFFVLSSVIAFVYAAGFFYPKTDINVGNHEAVIDLTENKFVTQYHFGEPTSCPDDSFCWSKNDYNANKWSRTYFPKQPIKRLPGYEAGEDKWIYYRINLTIPESLKNTEDEIAFSTLYIKHSSYFVYINGNIVSSGNMENDNSKFIVVPIPKNFISEDGKVTIGIKGSLFNSSDTGLSHRGKWYLGPEKVIYKLYLHGERALNTFYLLFLLTKGGIIAIFSIIYIFTSGQRGLLAFLIFAVFSTVESLFIGKFLTNIVTDPYHRLYAVFYFKTFAYLGLLSFFLSYWSVRRAKKYVVYSSMFFFGLISFSLYNFSSGGWFKVVRVLNLTNMMLLCVLAISILVGGTSYFMWTRMDLTKNKIAPIRNMVIASSLYFIAVLYLSFFSGDFKGFDIRPVLDLFFFLYVAIEIMQTFGNTEKRVVNLEGHMAEKARMQQELEDAKEISKVFLPSSVPNWDNIEISVFHKSFSENSGDWYSFETAEEGGFKFFFMCDVTGHGVQAAIVVSTCRAILLALRSREDRRKNGLRFVEMYLKELNETLYLQGEGYHLTTICALSFDIENKKLHHISAGHPFPIRIREKEDDNKKKISPMVATPHTNLGFKKNIDIQIKCEDLEDGDIIMVYTDGLLIEKNLRKIRSDYYIECNSFNDYSKGVIEYLKSVEKTKDVSLIDEDDLTLIAFKVNL